MGSPAKSHPDQWKLRFLDFSQRVPEPVAAFVQAVAIIVVLSLLAVAVFIIGLAIFIFLRVALDLVSSSTALQSNATIATFFSVLGGLIGAPFVIWRVLAGHWQSKAAVDQAEIARRAQRTQLFTKAAELLGTYYEDKATSKLEPHLELRMGGIHALDHIAQYSPEDHQAISNFLCAYIRSPKNCSAPVDVPATGDIQSAEIRKWADSVTAPRSDTAAAIRIIGRRRDWQVRTFDDRLDLHRAHLQHADFRDLDMSYVWLGYSRLEGALLIGANFQRAMLNHANLQMALCEDADFYGALVFSADLSRAHGLTQKQVSVMLGDGATTIPHNLTRPAHWPKFTLDWEDRRRWMRETLHGDIVFEMPPWLRDRSAPSDQIDFWHHRHAQAAASSLAQAGVSIDEIDGAKVTPIFQFGETVLSRQSPAHDETHKAALS